MAYASYDLSSSSLLISHVLRHRVIKVDSYLSSTIADGNIAINYVIDSSHSSSCCEKIRVIGKKNNV